MVMADQSAFLINTGDLVPYGLSIYYEHFRQLMAPFHKPFYPAPGNHDLELGSLDNFLKYSGAPAVHYSFDYGSVHFTIVNSASGNLDAPELAWLEADLAATSQPVKMVFLHHPPFDPHGGSHTLGRGAQELMALAVKYQVRYVIASHIHGYAREVRDGVIYLISGGAGAPLYYPPDNGGFYHYVRLTVNGTDVSEEVVKIAQD
jgi:3',5'-cyclic AMP phosphodiesterase CpdA